MQGKTRRAILILDNIFPATVSRWRAEEFCHYMKASQDESFGVDVDVGIRNYHPAFGPLDSEMLRVCAQDYPDAFDGYILQTVGTSTHIKHPHLSSLEALGRAAVPSALPPDVCDVVLTRSTRPRAMGDYALIYCLFAVQALFVMPVCRRYRIPMVCQSYPGGGTEYPTLRNEVASMFHDPLVRRVIATQQWMREHLRTHGLCPEDKVEFIHGVTLRMAPEPAEERASKASIDVAFCSAGAGGHVKGFDVFVQAALTLAGSDPRFRFHLIGGARSAELEAALPDEEGKPKRLFRHGYVRRRDEMARIYAGVDVLVAPGRRTAEHTDGFPVGCGTEAMMHGVALVTTDPCSSNVHHFGDALKGRRLHAVPEEIVVVEPGRADQIVAALTRFASSEEGLAELRAIGRRGKARVTRLYHDLIQLESRWRLLLAECDAEAGNGARAELIAIEDQIPVDFGGGCPCEKAVRVMELATRWDVRRAAEVGVYRGRSLVALLTAMRRTGGSCDAVDPYSAVEADEDDIANESVFVNPGSGRAAMDTWLRETDFDGIFKELNEVIERNGLSPFVRMMRMTSAKASDVVRAEGVVYDMVHIDGNHDTDCVAFDIKVWGPLIRRGGIMVMDDINLECVRRALPELDALGFEPFQSYGFWGVWIKL
jgi:glycosyltransferase involved in cell wall biosynthesis